MSTPVEPKSPRAWLYLVVAALSLILLIPAWTLFLMLVIQPSSLMQEPTVSKQVFWFLAVPALVVFGLVGSSWQSAVAKSKAAPEQAQPQSAAPAASISAAQQAQREYVLEVISLGVTLDKYRQGKLWDALSQGNPVTSIREQDPKKYPWSAQEKKGIEGGRVNDSLENGAKFTPMYWGVPSFRADSPSDDPSDPVSPTNTVGVIGSPSTSGLSWHLFVSADWELSERPDRLLERAFAFFDKYPDLPYVVLSASDGMYLRNLYRPKGTPPLIRDGNYIPDMPDTSALFILARRERVEAVRPFAFEDANHNNKNMLADELNAKGFARRLGLTYMDLREQVPQSKGSVGRNPTVPEWLQATAAFAQRDDIYPKGISIFNPVHGGPSKEFKPTQWFPIPWNKDQLAVFDRLPSLGYLHRPVFVPMVNKEGKPLTRRDERTAALTAGWQQALQTLPESQRKAAPARVIEATGGNVDQTIALTSVFSAWAEHGGPELDKGKPTQWINTDNRLGNTGAATWFMQMAIGVMGSHREGGVSAAINLRDPNEASIVLITPPPEAKRTSQKHPQGGDVFRHYATPAIDPGNYKP